MNPAVAFVPDVSKWSPWTPDYVAELFVGLEAPWYVAGGWAIDLLLGGRRRDHADLEIAVPRARFEEFAAALTEYELYAVQGGVATLVDEPALETTHQTWVRDPASDRWCLDIFREPSDGDTWIYRRDERIRLPYERVVDRTGGGVPYGTPGVVLLFKAADAGEAKHDDDFTAALPFMDACRREWLAEALELVHPGHPWLRRGLA